MYLWFFEFQDLPNDRHQISKIRLIRRSLRKRNTCFLNQFQEQKKIRNQLYKNDDGDLS